MTAGVSLLLSVGVLLVLLAVMVSLAHAKAEVDRLLDQIEEMLRGAD